MTAADSSLLSFVDTPVLVGDPDGRAAYVNPAFESCFDVSADGLVGRPLAELFEGGGREAVLRAVAEVCTHNESVRFRMREHGVGYAGTASPILAGDESVGVVILLKEEVDGVERLIALHREIQDPLDELGAALESLVEQTGGRRSEAHRAQVDDALRALTRVRKWTEQVNAILCGGPSPGADEIDLAGLVREVARRVAGDASGAGVGVDVVAPTSLPRLRADSAQLEAILVRMVRDRLEAGTGERIVLGARLQGEVAEGEGDERAAILSIVERGSEIRGPVSPPALAKEVLASSSGTIHVCEEAGIGRVTVVRIPLP